MVTGHITELCSLPWSDLRKMAFVCRGPRRLWRATRGLGLWPLHVRGRPGASAPKHSCHSCCRATALRQPASQLCQCRSGSWVTLGKGHHHPPPRERGRVQDENLPSVQLASFQGSEAGWQEDNSTLSWNKREPERRADKGHKYNLSAFSSLCPEGNSNSQGLE